MLTVASIPAAHPYVKSIVDPADADVLDDPVPHGATEPGQWWPPRWLDPTYLRHHLDRIDVVHAHFGFDFSTPAQLTQVVDLLDEQGVPLVLTVHDLENPHFLDQTAHVERLGILLPAADVVITLTDGAANEIERRWGRRAVVLPHPHVLPVEAIGARRTARHQTVIGIHAKALRANVDPWPLLDRLIDRQPADSRLRLDLDDDVLTGPRGLEVGARRLDRYRRAGVDVRMHRRFSDCGLAQYLAEIDVLVLPYRLGTHSGWIEACHDAGVQAVVPDCGYFHQQHDNPVFRYSIGTFDAASFDEAAHAAVRRARTSSPDEAVARRVQRAEQGRHVRKATGQLYRHALDLVASGGQRRGPHRISA
ncbi:MAG: glycosyltransferase [Mycobacterium sp.]